MTYKYDTREVTHGNTTDSLPRFPKQNLAHSI